MKINGSKLGSGVFSFGLFLAITLCAVTKIDGGGAVGLWVLGLINLIVSALFIESAFKE